MPLNLCLDCRLVLAHSLRGEHGPLEVVLQLILFFLNIFFVLLLFFFGLLVLFLLYFQHVLVVRSSSVLELLGQLDEYLGWLVLQIVVRVVQELQNSLLIIKILLEPGRVFDGLGSLWRNELAVLEDFHHIIKRGLAVFNLVLLQFVFGVLLLILRLIIWLSLVILLHDLVLE